MDSLLFDYLVFSQGQETVVHLTKTNTKGNQYTKIFAGCFNAKQAQKDLEQLLGKDLFEKYVVVVPLDVTKDDSVKQAAKLVAETCSKADPGDDGSSIVGLTSFVCFHGVAYEGPVQYIPLELFQKQMDVNFFGFVRIVQQFLPLIRTTLEENEKAAGRMIFCGTGGGPSTAACVPLLAAYMSSKFAGEAFAQVLKTEVKMIGLPIEVSVINPGFVRPTRLQEVGEQLMAQMWVQCEKLHGSSIAKDEYGRLLNHFVQYANVTPAAHVSEVSAAAEHALTAYKPRSSYKVGIDSKLAPIVGTLPTGVREKISAHGIYGILSPAGTVKGYHF